MGITDGDHICNLCGESLSSCYLCRDEPHQRTIYIGDIRRKKEQEDRESERELAQQSRSIRDAAERRWRNG